MSQELKPCPRCSEHLEPIYDDPHESDGRLLYYSHPDDTGCLFDDFMLLAGYEDQWQSLPRHTEPQWLPIETAPKEPVEGHTLIGWCEHGKDPYYLDGGKRLTTYGAHCEGLGPQEDGVYSIVWGGEESDYDEFSDKSWTIPDWWFIDDGTYEKPVNPTMFMLLPNPPEVTT